MLLVLKEIFEHVGTFLRHRLDVWLCCLKHLVFLSQVLVQLEN